MNKEEQQYLDLLANILENGSDRDDRTGVGTKSIFGTQLRFSLEDHVVPILTTKKVYVKGVIEELLFFLRGETDTKTLEDEGVNIWKGNTSREFLDSHGKTGYKEGEMGPMYGWQWRHWGGCNWTAEPGGIDQIANVIRLLKTDPYSRRIVISSWNTSDLDNMVLAPCHLLAQFYANDDELSCQFYMRSSDFFLGWPFNIASYAILTHIIANVVGMRAKEVIFCGGDTHVYKNHVKQVKTQLTREPYPFPKLYICKTLNTIQDIEKLKFEDFELEGYKSHPAIKADMAI